MSAFRSASVNSTPATTLTITTPSGAVAGDVLVAYMMSDEAGNIISAPEGWSNGPTDNSNDVSIATFYHVLDGSPPSNYSFVNTPSLMIGGIIAIDPEGGTDPQVNVSTVAHVGATSVATPNVANVENPRTFLAIFGNDTNFNVATPPSGMTAAHELLQMDSISLAAYVEVDPADVGNISRTITWDGNDTTVAIGILVSFTEGSEEPTAPTISSISDSTLTHGQTGIVITLTGASETGNTVLISPTDDVEDALAVAQTITAESTTEITFTADLDSFDFGTLYLFVVNADSESNETGEVISRVIGSATLSATFIDQDDQPRTDLTNIKLSIWRGGTISGAPDQQITAETTDEAGLFETEIEVGALEDGDKPFVVVEVGSPPTIWTCGLKDVTYE